MRAAAGPPSQPIVWLARMQDGRSGGLGYGSAKATSARETLAAFFACSSRPGYNNFQAATKHHPRKLSLVLMERAPVVISPADGYYPPWPPCK